MSTPISFPRMLAIRQKFPVSPRLDIPAVVQHEFRAQKVLSRLQPGAQIDVAVGSRGMTSIKDIVAAVLDELKAAGAKPFIIPAMGSHGGATPEGQIGVLESYGITEHSVDVPIRASMEVERLGTSADGVEVFCSVEALRSEGIVIVNRVKPHTDFTGTHGSGVMKMIVIGLGKRTGAATCHGAAARLGLERVIHGIARVTLRRAPILCGVAIVENHFHDTARIAVLKPDEIEVREKELLDEARQLMPRLPFDDIDVLIVDRIGKNISGSGMDPNVTGRWVHGYSTSLADDNRQSPRIRRIFVRDLTPETHGNAIGVGFAAIQPPRLVNAMDKRVTYVNAMTSLTPHGAKIPIHFDTDRQAIEQALASLAIPDVRQAKVVRIADTLSLVNLEVSEAYASLVTQRPDLETVGSPRELTFDEAGCLLQEGGS